MSDASDAPQPIASDQAVFLSAWQTYRKVMDNNCMFHREVYEVLRRILIAEAPRGFRFLDIACGDAACSVTALRGTDIAAYTGIDISRPALDLAERGLEELGCPVSLIQQDFSEALADWQDPVDVVWVGQSLHHQRDSKLDFMRDVRRVLAPAGLFLIWEPTWLDGEDRAGWLARFDAIRHTLWSMLDDAEWTAMRDHIHAADFPETASRWLSLGRDAGFGSGREVFVAPNKLNRVYCFGN